MEGDEIGEVEIGECVAGNDEEGVVLEGFLRVLDAAGCPEWLLLIGIGEFHPEFFAVTEIVPDERGQELDGDHGLGEPVPFEQPEHVLHDGPVHHRQERLGHA